MRLPVQSLELVKIFIKASKIFIFIVFFDKCAAIYYSATRPSKLLDGYQDHPPFLPVAWDRPAATETGSEMVYPRYTFIQSTFVDSRRQCKMRLKPENRKDPLPMIYVT
jgi:hypothetical protein